MLTINEQLSQWEDDRIVELVVSSMSDSIKNSKPVVYVVGSAMSGSIARALNNIGIGQVFIVDKLPEYKPQVDELLDYGSMFEAPAILQKSRLGITLLDEISNNQVRNRNDGWYRQFEKNSRKRNLRG